MVSLIICNYLGYELSECQHESREELEPGSNGARRGVKGEEGRTWMDQHIAPNVPRTLAAMGIFIEDRLNRLN